MSTKRYNKIVRDKIPEIIQSGGKTCSVSVLSEEEYIDMLDRKLNEELAEYQESKSLEELADLLEVMHAIALARGSSMDEIENLRVKKRTERGGFEKRLLLTEVRDGQLIYRKYADWSLFKDGFAIPLARQEYFQSIESLRTKEGENKAIVLFIDGISCPAELRNIPINRGTAPNHSPIIQVRYKPNDKAPSIFRQVFKNSYEDLLLEKNAKMPKQHLQTEVYEYFDMYSTETPMTFRIECHPLTSEEQQEA